MDLKKLPIAALITSLFFNSCSQDETERSIVNIKDSVYTVPDYPDAVTNSLVGNELGIEHCIISDRGDIALFGEKVKGGGEYYMGYVDAENNFDCALLKGSTFDESVLPFFDANYNLAWFDEGNFTFKGFDASSCAETWTSETVNADPYVETGVIPTYTSGNIIAMGDQLIVAWRHDQLASSAIGIIGSDNKIADFVVATNFTSWKMVPISDKNFALLGKNQMSGKPEIRIYNISLNAERTDDIEWWYLLDDAIQFSAVNNDGSLDGLIVTNGTNVVRFDKDGFQIAERPLVGGTAVDKFMDAGPSNQGGLLCLFKRNNDLVIKIYDQLGIYGSEMNVPLNDGDSYDLDEDDHVFIRQANNGEVVVVGTGRAITEDYIELGLLVSRITF